MVQAAVLNGASKYPFSSSSDNLKNHRIDDKTQRAVTNNRKSRLHATMKLPPEVVKPRLTGVECSCNLSGRNLLTISIIIIIVCTLTRTHH